MRGTTILDDTLVDDGVFLLEFLSCWQCQLAVCHDFDFTLKMIIRLIYRQAGVIIRGNLWMKSIAHIIAGV